MKSIDTGKKFKFDYKWIIVVLCFLMVMVGLGFGSSTKSLFPDEISKELGIPRSLIVIGDSCRYISTAVVNVFFGALIAKFGPKKLICAGFVSLTAAAVIYAYAQNLFMLYLAGALLGVGFAWTSTTIVGYIVNIWHPERKGTVMGAILASNGIGGAIAIKVVGYLIDPNTVGSYRMAYRAMAIIFAVTLLILLLFLRDKNSDANAPRVAAKKSRGRDWEGIEFSVLLRKFYFWGALVCIFFSGFILQGTHGIVAMHYKDVGIDYSAVTSILSFSSVILAFSKFATGFVYDKFGLRTAASICTTIAIVAAFVLASVTGGTTGMVLAVIYAVISNFALPLETVMLPIYATDLCGNKSYGKVLGIFVSVNTAGFALASPVMNACYDLWGSYVPALIATGIAMVVVLVLLQFVISAAHKEQAKILAAAENRGKEELTPA